MQCICSCFAPTTFIRSVPRKTTPPLVCLICKQEVTNECVSCPNCRFIIGHESCALSWVLRRGTCPNCNREFQT